MIRRHRNQLVRELWILRSSLGPNTGSRPPGPAGGLHHSGLDHKNLSAIEMQIKSSLNSLLKRLDIDELENLVESVKSKGTAQSRCIQLPPNYRSQSDESDTQITPAIREIPPHRLMCRIWRWPDLTPMDTLKSVPTCQHNHRQTASGNVCLNPYHWSRVIQTGKYFSRSTSLAQRQPIN